MQRILSLMAARHGFDFGGYRRSSLERRIRSRADALGIPDISAYLDYLRTRPAEATALLDTLFVHVTSFFRDPEVWTTLARLSLLPLRCRARDGDAIRIWNPGCATGEETYTLLMVLEKVIGADAMRRGVRIIATDIDARAIAVANRGAYRADQLASVPPTLRDTYFRFSGSEYTFRSDLRDVVHFHTHDLVHSAPVPDVDLVICRNTLMYFDSDTRRRVLLGIHRAARPGGHIFVGRTESLLAHTDRFRPVDYAARIFERAPVSSGGIAG